MPTDEPSSRIIHGLGCVCQECGEAMLSELKTLRARCSKAEAALGTVELREKYELSWIDTIAYEKWKEESPDAKQRNDLLRARIAELDFVHSSRMQDEHRRAPMPLTEDYAARIATIEKILDELRARIAELECSGCNHPKHAAYGCCNLSCGCSKDANS